MFNEGKNGCMVEKFDDFGVAGCGRNLDENNADTGGSNASGEPKTDVKFLYRSDKNFIKKSAAKNALVFAILGLILGPFAGIGIFFSVAGLALGVNCRAKSTAKTWAIAVAVTGVILNAAFIAALIVALTVYGVALPTVPIE